MTQPQDTVSFGARFVGRSNTIAKVQKDLEKAIKENNVKEILEYLRYRCKVDENNLLTIDEYIPKVDYWDTEHDMFKRLSFSELGINENNLFKKIVAIKREARFDYSPQTLTNLGELKKIGGSADFQNSKITNLGKT